MNVLRLVVTYLLDGWMDENTPFDEDGRVDLCGVVTCPLLRPTMIPDGAILEEKIVNWEVIGLQL